MGILNNIFKFKKTKKMETITRNVVVTEYSQSHVLQHIMKEAGLKHGDTVTADIAPVRLEQTGGTNDNGEPVGKMIAYFCHTQSIEVKNFIEAGDGGAIPSEVILDNIKIDTKYNPGLYTLKNVKLSSNGTMQVIATAETTWEAV